MANDRAYMCVTRLHHITILILLGLSLFFADFEAASYHIVNLCMERTTSQEADGVF